MYYYNYTKPVGLLQDQLLQEVWDASLYPQTYDINGDVIFGFVVELSGPDEATLAGVVAAYVVDANWREKLDPWCSPCYPMHMLFLEISALDIVNEELTVKRTINAEDFFMVCGISESLRHLNTAGELNVGDFVYVIYEDEDHSKPIAIAKKAL